MRPAMCKESGQNMRVPTLRALPVGRRNWLEDFDATCAADENTMGISVQNNGHRGAFGCEHRFPDVSSQRGGNSRIGGSDEGIHLQQSQPEVERIPPWSSDRSACASAPVSVNSNRRFMPQSCRGKHNATRWFHASAVGDSDAISREPICA
jgi:hypothetical protein